MSLHFLWRLWKNTHNCAMCCSLPMITRFLKQCVATFRNFVGIRFVLPPKRAITTIRLPILQPMPSANKCIVSLPRSTLWLMQISLRGALPWDRVYFCSKCNIPKVCRWIVETKNLQRQHSSAFPTATCWQENF